MATTCEQGGRHRWDESRSHCLDCGRDAATIAEELEDWLAQTEDQVDRLSDQIEAMRALLKDWLESVAQHQDPTERTRALLAELEAEYEP